MAPKEEKRADPTATDKKKYTQAEFVEFYGKKKANALWKQAGEASELPGPKKGKSAKAVEGKDSGKKASGKDGGSNSLARMRDYKGCVLAEYVWLDANQGTRSKTMTMTQRPTSPKDLRVWNYDGSSTGQAEGHNSEVLLFAKAIFEDPFRGAPHILVLAEAVNAWDSKPAIGNTRAECSEVMEKYKSLDPWFGIEQEYTIMYPGKVGENATMPYGFNKDGSEPAPQGPYYCAAGTGKALGREVAYEHYMKCLEAGVKIAGSNAEVMPGQWEYQVGPCRGVEMGDHLTISRYIMHRVTEKYNVIVTFDPKPKEGDWNGAGCHTNFSVTPMRKEGGYDVIKKVCEAFGKVAAEHIAVYGEGNEKRLTGKHETASINEFSYGVANRGASIRIPRDAEKDGKGYMEDRRPAANCDPYAVIGKMMKTTGECLAQPPNRIFKLCVEAESEKFKADGKVCSELDKTDGFIHLSDRSSAPVVAGLFFKDAKDLRLIELSAKKLPGDVSWIVGKMGDEAPSTPAGDALAIHYLVPDGCVHVYGAAGVPTSAIVREAPVPLGADGKHVFPKWL